MGLFYVGLSAADGYEASRELRWDDDRNGNRDRTADAALEMVKEYLAQEELTLRPLWRRFAGETFAKIPLSLSERVGVRVNGLTDPRLGRSLFPGAAVHFRNRRRATLVGC